MATRSHIGLRNLDGTVDYIYCHYDGYPQHNGKILAEHYQDIDKVKQLLELGSLSILSEEIGEQQDFDDRSTHNEKWCLAYGRDRNQPNTSKRNTYFDNLLKDDNVDYLYVFDGNYWKCYDTYTPGLNIDLYNTQPTQS
jgi:hypothetical protein